MAERHRKVGSWKLWIGVVLLIGLVWYVINVSVGVGAAGY